MNPTTDTKATRHESGTADTYRKALEVNLDPTNFGSFAEIGAGQEVARWFLRVGGASGTVAKTISAYDKDVSDDLYGAGMRYVSRQRLEAMVEQEWQSLLQQVGLTRGRDCRLFTFASTIAARNFAGTNDCHGWMGMRFQEQPRSEFSEILLHLNFRDESGLSQHEAAGMIGVNLVHSILIGRKNAMEMPPSLLDGLGKRVEIDQILVRGRFVSGCDLNALHVNLVRNQAAEAITVGPDGTAVAANEFLYKKAVVIAPAAQEPRHDLSDEAMAACTELLREGGSAAEETRNVVAMRLVQVSEHESPPTYPGQSVLMTGHRPLHIATSFVRRYTSGPVIFALPLPSLARMFDEVRLQQQDGRLLDSIARLLGANVQVVAGSCPRDQLHGLDPAWDIPSDAAWLTADRLRPPAPSRHLYQYLLESGFLRAMPRTPS